MPLTRVLITVKTYPTLSSKYEELVCTAGFLEDGRMIRIYPVPFRKKAFSEQYSKYDWIELDLVKNHKDFRPESYRPASIESNINIVGKIGTEHNWALRKSIVLQNVYFNLEELIAEAKNKEHYTSLAVYKPAIIHDFIAEKVESEWSKEKLETLKQWNIFDVEGADKRLKIVRKLPYKFSFKFSDETGKDRTLMIEDWETGQLYWRQLAKHEGDEEKAIADVKNKYLNELALKCDLYFFLGTTKVHHMRAPNPFIIIGAFYPKRELQGSLF